jgi:hypothetical protein
MPMPIVPGFVPGFWMNETSGVLRPAVEAYLRREPMTPNQIAAMRAYLRQWMDGDWHGPMIDVLRTKLDEIHTPKDIRDWMRMALRENIDPL